MTAPDHSTTGFDSNARGLAVLAAAVVVGLLLLLNAGDGGASTQEISTGDGDGTVTTIDISNLGDDDDETTTTTPDQTTTSSIAETEDTRPPTEVKVLVLNSGGPTGTAGTTSDTIGETGYVMQPADNATTRGAATTTVYYADGYQADAEAVAAVLGKSADVVEAMPETSPGPGAESSNVVVVLGADTPPASSGSSGGGTTTTSGN
jgi:LytR cell envelope-related transcriptional attenuator